MWPLALPIIVQALLIAHVIKTGRNTLWIWALLIPYAGALAYIAFELLPELLRGRTGRRAARTLGKVLDPQGDLRKFENEAKVTGNVASRQRYADELARQERFDEAIVAYRAILTGLYEHDPNMMLGLARAQFDKGDAPAARATLDDLIRLNPDFKSAEGHLLYARALETSGDVEKALKEYDVLAPYYPGAEAGARYAQLLHAQGRTEEARKVAQELLDEARIAPAHYRRAQKTWLESAERLLGR
jgi:hypothetical protein